MLRYPEDWHVGSNEANTGKAVNDGIDIREGTGCEVSMLFSLENFHHLSDQHQGSIVRRDPICLSALHDVPGSIRPPSAQPRAYEYM